MLMPAIMVAAPVAAQDSDAEIVLHGCKNAVIEHIVRAGGRSVSVVRFPPGALVWVARQTGSRVQGAGQYRDAARAWRDFTYQCTYDHTDATARVKVQRAEHASAPAQASLETPPAPPPAARVPPHR
jgi:hypothetical protein